MLSPENKLLPSRAARGRRQAEGTKDSTAWLRALSCTEVMRCSLTKVLACQRDMPRCMLVKLHLKTELARAKIDHFWLSQIGTTNPFARQCLYSECFSGAHQKPTKCYHYFLRNFFHYPVVLFRVKISDHSNIFPCLSSHLQKSNCCQPAP